jgi:hypothetical protein
MDQVQFLPQNLLIKKCAPIISVATIPDEFLPGKNRER